MKLSLREVDFADGDDMAMVQTTSLQDNELLQALHCGLGFDESLAASKERWPSVYGFPNWHYKKVVDDDTGKIVGFSRWMIDDEHRPPKTGLPEGMELGDQGYAITSRYLDNRPNMMLDSMGTIPEYREHGADTLMLEWGTAFADKHGLLTYVESEPENASLYLKHGFEKVDTITASADGKTFKLDALLREPKARAPS